MVNENTSKNFIKVLKGSVVSVIITLILLLIFSVLLTYTNIKESAIPTVIIAITALSILIGSQITTSSIKNNGISNGALRGGIYVACLYVVSSIISKNFSLNKYSIFLIAASLVTGALGGIIGVNKK